MTPSTSHPSLPAQLLAAFDLLVFERRGAGEFGLAAAPPLWSHPWGLQSTAPGDVVFPDLLSPFLECWIEDAEEHWAENRAGVLRSGTWSERVSETEHLQLEALAIRTEEGDKALVVQPYDDRFRGEQALYQRARENVLMHRRLVKEMEKTDLLLHCIVHDLKNPLAGIMSVLSVLERRGELSDTSLEAVQMCQEQGRRQERIIQQVFEAFHEQLDAAQTAEESTRETTDLRTCAEDMVRRHRPVFEERGVRLESESELSDAEPTAVHAQHDQLERVFDNLLENALRFSAPESSVCVRTCVDDDRLRAEVIDQGPGVPEGMRERLFEKFAQGADGRGSAGLGLFLCRNHVRRWGGDIGFRPNEPNGAVFWFQLRRALATAE